MKPALLIIDMTNEFVHGRLSTPEAKSTVDPIKMILNEFRSAKKPVIFVKDAHYPYDFELRVWGKHSMSGDDSSRIISELNPGPDEIIVEKHHYSGFYNTQLESILRGLGIDTVFLVGLDADICVRHTAADAFYRGYSIVVVKEAVAAYMDKEWEKYFKMIYGAKIIGIRDFSLEETMEKQPQQ